MRYIRKIQFDSREITDLLTELDGYMWVAIDVRRGVMAGGDEWVTQLKRDLLGVGCRIQDVYGVGLDLVTGEIDYYSDINAKVAFPGSTREVPLRWRERVETLVRYFFEELPIYKEERRGRYVRYEQIIVQ